MRSYASTNRFRRHRETRDEGGFFTIWVLGLCVMVMFVGGLSFDLWHSFSDKRELSSIVDGAAVAAASQIDLDAFRNDSTSVKIDSPAARSAVQTYLARAQTETGLVLTNTSVNFVDGNVVVTASTTTQLTLTKLFLPSGDLPSTVTGVATPRQAQ